MQPSQSHFQSFGLLEQPGLTCHPLFAFGHSRSCPCLPVPLPSLFALTINSSYLVLYIFIYLFLALQKECLSLSPLFSWCHLEECLLIPAAHSNLSFFSVGGLKTVF